MIPDTDIDIDFVDRDKAAAALPCVAASMDQRGERIRHVTGVYFQNAPVDPVGEFCSIPYEKAAALGYFKIDLLNNSIYTGIRDEAHLLSLMEREPPWEFFLDRSIVSQLAQIANHFGVVKWIAPKNVTDLATVLALIRPGKRHLMFKPRAQVEAEIWLPDQSGYNYKKAHAVSYAVSIVVQLNLLVEQVMASLDGQA